MEENKVNVTPSAMSIEEYQSQVQKYITELAELRADGTKKIQDLKYENKNIKLKKHLDAVVKKETIAQNNEEIAKAKEVAAQNAQKVKEVVKEATQFANTNYVEIYKNDKAKFKEIKAELKVQYHEAVALIKKQSQDALQTLIAKVTDPKKLKLEKKILKEETKSKLFDAKRNYLEGVQKAKDELHDSYLFRDNLISEIKDGKRNILDKFLNFIENYIYNFNLKNFLMKNGLYIIILIFMIICICIKPSLISKESNWLILKNFSTKVFFALGVAGLILLAGTDLAIGRIVALSSVLTCVILNPNTPVKFFGHALPNIYETLGFGGAVVVAILLSVALSVLFSLIAGFFSAKFKIHPFISTLGTSLVIWGLLGYSTNNSPTGTITDEALNIGNLTIGKNMPITLIYAVIAIVLVWFIWNKTKFGKNMYAVGGNPEAATVSGISVFKVTLGVFAMAGILYGLGGFFQATVTGSSKATFAQGWELEAIAACVIGGISFTGGIGKISGAVIGCLLFEILKYYLRGVFGGTADIANIFIGIIIIVAVTFDSIKYLKKK